MILQWLFNMNIPYFKGVAGYCNTIAMIFEDNCNGITMFSDIIAIIVWYEYTLFLNGLLDIAIPLQFYSNSIVKYVD